MSELRTLRHLVHEHTAMRPYVLNGLLRSGEVAACISATKGRKSWLLADLAIAIATGQPWLGKWETHRGDVLLIDAELHPEVISNRIPQIVKARGLAMADVETHLYVEPVRGTGMDIFRLKSIVDSIPRHQFAAIIVDPLYRMYPQDGRFDENSNADVAHVFNTIDAYAEQTGAAWVICHHATKGAQAGKAVTDVGAGGGSFSRAVDTHIVVRPHEVDDCAVMSVALRSWPPVQDTCYKWDAPVWNLDTTLDPAKLKDAQPYSHWKKREPYRRKTVKRTSTEIMELVTNLIPEGDNYVDSQDICFFAKDQDLSDRKVYRALNALVKRDMIECRRGKGPEPAVFRRKQAVKAKKGE
jgi:hypothetical protein